MNNSLAAWLSSNPELPVWAEETGRTEAELLQILSGGMDETGCSFLAASTAPVPPPSGAYCNAFIRSRGVWLWAFQTEADRAAFQASLPRTLIRKSTVIRRCHEAGKLAAVMAILDHPANAYAKARWWAPDWPEVFADDPEMVAMLTAVGADVAVITAPEGA